MVHGRIGDVERKRCHRRIHKDAKVVAQIGTGNAEGVHRCQDERVSGDEEGDRGIFDKRGFEEGRHWLYSKGFFVSVTS